MRRLLLAIGVAFTFVALGMVACDADAARTGAITCERVYRVCPSIAPASSDDATECADIFQSRCGAEMRQHIQCATGKCDDAGAVDRVEVERVCFATIRAYRDCLESDGGEAGPDEGPDEGQLPPFPTDAAATRD